MSARTDPSDGCGTSALRRRETYCRLRDGTRLHTIVLLPPGTGPWPAVLSRHPYDIGHDEHAGLVEVERFVVAGYVVALQDVRGRFGSEGDFDPCAQEQADGADAVAWLAALPECDGAVAMWGASYASDTQFAALLGGAPALTALAAAVTPSLSALDGFRFRGGVPELGSTLAWTHYAIAPHAIARIEDTDARAREHRRWLATEDAIVSGRAFDPGSPLPLPDVEGIVRWGLERLVEPLDSHAHHAGKIVDRVQEVDVPVLLIGGWYDVFLGSTLDLYRRLRNDARGSARTSPRLVVGPWSHDNMTGRFEDCDFGPAASAGELWGRGDLTEQHIRWFDENVRGHHPPPEAPVGVFVMGENRWIGLAEFPPPNARNVDLHLSGEGALQPELAAPAQRSLLSDPLHPVPTRGGAVLLFRPYGAGPADQAQIELRQDVLSWRTAPLDDAMTVLGRVSAVVHVTTTGTDADVVVRLCDEHPDGRSIVIADGVQRGSAQRADRVTGRGARGPMMPGEVHEFGVDLWATAHTFLAGHRVRVDIAPSSSPRWQVGSNTYSAQGGDQAPVSAEYTIHLGGAHPSRLIVEVVDALPE